jgi:Na+(H+)/acetate symporter ActP
MHSLVYLADTSQADEYYVAGRRHTAIYNGMATAADWMSAATFISPGRRSRVCKAFLAREDKPVAWLT